MFLVMTQDGHPLSRHRKWERAIDNASKFANQYRSRDTREPVDVYHQNGTGNRELFSTSVYEPNRKTGGGCVRTTFTEYSKSIRYTVTDAVDRIPHDQS